MSLNLHPDLRKRLISFLEAPLPELIVKHRQFLDYKSTLCLKDGEKVLPTKGPLKNELDKILYEEPLFELTSDHIRRTLLNTEEFCSYASDVSISTLKAFHDISSAAVSIIEAFEELPFRYTHTFELPRALRDQFAWFSSPYELSQEVRVITANDQFATDFPLKSLSLEPENSLLSESFRHQVQNWNKNSVYFPVEADGYVQELGNSKTTIEAEATLR